MARVLDIILPFTVALFLVGSASVIAAPPETNDPFYSSVPSAYMDDPRRTEWQKADLVIEYLLIKPGDTIADIGAGTGFFSTRFAKKVGKNGLVYASDVDETMVRGIEKRASKEGLTNIRSILGKMDDPLIPRASADVVFICDTYLFIEDRIKYLTHLKESIKKSGRLAVISFNASADIPGAPPQQRMVPKEVVIREVLSAGYVLEADFHFLPFQDFLLFRKP